MKAGRPRRQDFFGAQGVERETVHWNIDKRLAQAVRELSGSRLSRRTKNEPSISQVAEGLVWWGAYCAYHHRPAEAPTWTIEEADQAGLTTLLNIKRDKLGVLTKDGHFVEDKYSDPSIPKRKRKRNKIKC